MFDKDKGSGASLNNLLLTQSGPEPAKEDVFILSSKQIQEIIGQATAPLIERIKVLEAAEAFKTLASFKVLWDRIDLLSKSQDGIEANLEGLKRDQSSDQRKKAAGKKTEERMMKLALTLLDRGNNPLTFSEVGKILELGTRTGNKNTREQNMTHFGRKLANSPERFIVRPCKSQGGKQVALTKIYFDHICKEYVG